VNSNTFMIRQTRESDLQMFSSMAKAPKFASPADVPYSILLPAFVTSELKTAFQIGFMLFLPFLVIDLVVSSVLMSLGMMMMSPTIVSLPFKLLLFVLVDGWAAANGQPRRELWIVRARRSSRPFISPPACGRGRGRAC
jgi:flagellar biosynthetic protein FliP